MASVFGHSLAAIALGKTFSEELRKPKFWILGILCSLEPDVDILGFRSKKKCNVYFWLCLILFYPLLTFNKRAYQQSRMDEISQIAIE